MYLKSRRVGKIFETPVGILKIDVPGFYNSPEIHSHTNAAAMHLHGLTYMGIININAVTK